MKDETTSTENPELNEAVEETQEVVSRGLYRRPTNLKELEEEKEAETEQSPSEPAKENEADTSETTDLAPEEATFKKRYGDLRRYAQRKQDELKAENAKLRQQIEETAKKATPKLPTTPEELEVWRKNYPDVYNIVRSIALQTVEEGQTKLKPKIEEFENLRADVNRERAHLTLRKYHPDMDELQDDVNFHHWMDKQPKYLQSLIYDTMDDPHAAARVIDLYKAECKIVDAGTKDTAKKAAQSVKVNAKPDASNDGKRVFKESEINKMHPKEYERLELEIDKAHREGRIVYDITAPRR